MTRSLRRMRTPLLVAAGALTALCMLFPYVVMALTALKPDTELISIPPRLLPDHWAFENFLDVWKVAPLWQHLKVTLIVAGVSTVITLLAALPAAYYTARFSFRGRGAFLGLVLVTQMFSPIALVIGLYREFLMMGLVDSYVALIITNAAFNLAFTIWILNAFFRSIPEEIEQAAMVDGCTRLGALVRVVLPLALPGIVTSVIFSFIAAWNEYVIALTLINTPENQPLTLGITSFIGLNQTQWQYLFAASVIAIVPVVILFATIERYLVSGLTAGGVK
jgi:multiple sugar transport system permease protein